MEETEEAQDAISSWQTADFADEEAFDLSQEALSFVAGYVAAKCRQIDRSLGEPTATAIASAVPASWIRAVSEGGLTVPSSGWLNVVRDFELSFALLMGKTADMEPGIMRRLLLILTAKYPLLDSRIARKLASTRLHLRLRAINQKSAAGESARRRARAQVRNHLGRR